MSKEYIVPLQNANTERIYARNLIFPPHIRDEVGIDLEKTIRLMNIGGINSLTISGGDLRPRKEDFRVGSQKNLSWRDLSICVDTKELAKNIAQDKNSNPDHAESWAKPLNSKIRGAIRQNGIAFSLKPSSAPLDYIGDLASLFLAGSLSYEIATQNTALGAVDLFALILIQAAKTRSKKDYSFRGDILFTSHVGRAFWTAFRANTAYRNLVIAMDNESPQAKA